MLNRQLCAVVEINRAEWLRGDKIGTVSEVYDAAQDGGTCAFPQARSADDAILRPTTGSPQFDGHFDAGTIHQCSRSLLSSMTSGTYLDADTRADQPRTGKRLDIGLIKSPGEPLFGRACQLVSGSSSGNASGGRRSSTRRRNSRQWSVVRVELARPRRDC
jgi:hypothetical protein